MVKTIGYVTLNILAIGAVVMGLWYLTVGQLDCDTTLFRLIWEWIR